MTTLTFVGQAPARSGDGRAFTGPSGSRLTRMLELTNYEALAARVELRNLLPEPVTKSPSGRGDTFDRGLALQHAKKLLIEWGERPELVVAIACGHEVYRALTMRQGRFFEGVAATIGPAQFLDIWCFPHPSGASSFWNEARNAAEAKRFLHRLVKHYGIDMAR